MMAVLIIGAANTAVPANAAAQPPTAAQGGCRTRPQLSALSLPADPVHSGSSVRGTVRLGCAPHRATTVSLTSADPSWVRVPATVTVPAGAQEAGFDIQTLQADYIYGTLPVNVTASLRTDTFTRPLTLLPGLKYVVVPDRVISGDGFSVELGLNGTAPTGGATLTLESDNPAVKVPASINIPSGAMGVSGHYGKTTRVPDDADVTITVKLADQTKTAAIALAAWTYDPGDWSLTGPASMYGGGFYKRLTLDLPNPVPHGGVRVTLTSDNPRMYVPAPLDLLQGSTTAAFDVYAGYDIDADVTITATIEGVGTRSHLIHVLPGLKEFQGIPFPNATGGRSFDATVHLGTVTSRDLVIQLESDDPALQVPAEVVIPAGQSSATFTATPAQVTDFREVTLTARLGDTFFSDYVYIEP